MNALSLPSGLTDVGRAYPTYFIPAADLETADGARTAAVNNALHEALCRAQPDPLGGQALVKVHIGEERCRTRMRPEYTEGQARFLRERGIAGVAAGDTTVAYTGPRGHRQNEDPGANAYRALARKQGWASDGPARMPFVVLDKPATSVEGVFSFSETERRMESEGIERFRDFYAAGGFLAADFLVNNAHLTLHGLAGVAGCVKSLAMGLASLKGKLRMHQSLLPGFDDALCKRCGRCVANCPENALTMPDDESAPVVDPDRCIGCGECEAVCVFRAVTLRAEDIHDWERGQATLPVRMADYTMGLMQGRWERSVHVLHMYTVTERCDCIDMRQSPMIGRSLGFLVGKNPFAIDRTAGRMLAQALTDENKEGDPALLPTAAQAAAYVAERYGVLPETPLEEIPIR